MNANLRKEIRIVMPVVMASIVVMWLAGLISINYMVFVGQDMRELLMTVVNGGFLLGCLFVGIRSFCAEFQHGTVELMLVQPVSRLEQWVSKRQVQFYSLFILSLAFVVAVIAIVWEPWNKGSALRILGWLDHTEAIPLLVVPVLAYLTCPLWAMLLRGTISAAAISVMSPMVASVPFLIWAATMGKEPAPWISAIAALSYVVVCHHFGKRYFFRMQVTGGRVGDIDLGEKILRLLGPGRVQAERIRQSSFWALFKKELCLQQASVLLCLLMLFIFGIMFLFDTIFSPTSSSWQYVDGQYVNDYAPKYVVILAFYVFLVPLVSACIAMTEERASGIHLWQITLPVSRTRQWLIKLAGLASINLILAVLIPGLLLLLFPAVRIQVLSSVGNDREFLEFVGEYLAEPHVLFISA